MRLYDSSQIDKNHLLFSGNDLKKLLIPLMIEQLLNSLMGMVDTMMVSNVGSEAISAVSLVDSINTLVIQVFAAMATGAAIICSQYIGRGDHEGSNRAAKQIFLTVVVISAALTLVGLLFRQPLLHLIFGAIEPGVMEKANIYFLITVLSYPFIALFNAGAAFFRASGDAKYPMKVSVSSNLINIAGNAILIFALDMGVAGAALATLASRIFCTVVVFHRLARPGQEIVLNHYFSIRPDLPLIVKILAIGVPSGIENGMFQFGKLAIQSTVSTLGTAAIAAQAMAIIFENVNGVAGIGIGIGLMTVVGQAIGAGRKEEAKYYIVKLADKFQKSYIEVFKNGVEIDGGERCLPAKVKCFPEYENIAFIELFEGKFHQVKRMFTAVENNVEKLVRIQMGGLVIPEKLGLGEYMEILHKDVENLLKTPDFDEVFGNIGGIFSSYWINKL